jgi:hypothetical protein
MRTLYLAVGCLTAMAGDIPAAYAGSASQAADLYTTYNVADASLSWSTCGSVPGSDGCYGSGNVGPFTRICAVLETPKQFDAASSEQRIFVVDGNDSGKHTVSLSVFTKRDVVSGPSATTTITRAAKIDLPLNRAPGDHCFAARNAAVLVVGTAATTTAAIIDETNFNVSTLGGFSPPINVSSVLANEAGYISINYGSSAADSGFILLGPDGTSVEDGGGMESLFGSQNAYLR